MKRMNLIVCFTVFISRLLAQSASVSGKIMNEQGFPVPFASVILQGAKTGVHADSIGFFTINVTANAYLVVTAVGYVGDTVKLNGENNLSIMLKKNPKNMDKVVINGQTEQKPNSSAADNTTINDQAIGNGLHDTYQNMFNGQTISSGMGPGGGMPSRSVSSSPGFGNTFSGTFLPQFTHTEETRGSKYLFDKWVGGVVVDTANNIIDNKSYLFNYDKISRGILMTQDMKSAMEINKDQVKAFALKSDNGVFYIFEQVPGLENGNFLQQLVKGNKFLLYKSIKTKFIKSNYRTDGLTESGNNYDEYLDEFRYYVLQVGAKDYKEIELKKKSIKSVLSNQTDKVNAYFSQHADDSIDESFLKGLIIFLNQ
ncbi:MAG TPA: carboxypeptidase-like regulatory domain-containing protein [Puia sp.]|nr:carboxypeptidase-like regulatory domain-containing protein [Puia sp.]